MPRFTDYVRAIPHLWRLRNEISTSASRGLRGVHVDSAIARTSRRGQVLPSSSKLMPAFRIGRRRVRRRVGRRRRVVRGRRRFGMRRGARSQGNLAWRKAKVTYSELWRMNDGNAIFTERVVFNQSLSGCFAMFALNTPKLPDAYRLVHKWKTFKFTGMKMVIEAVPKQDQAGNVAEGGAGVHNFTALLPPFSLISKRFAGHVLMAPQTGTQATYGPAPGSVNDWSPCAFEPCVGLARQSHDFRQEPYPLSGVSAFAKKRVSVFFRRYIRCGKSVGRGELEEVNTVEPVGDAAGQYVNVPSINYQQEDQVLQYVIPNMHIQSNTTVQWRVKRTWYMRLRDRRPEIPNIPAYERRICERVGVDYPTVDCVPAFAGESATEEQQEPPSIFAAGTGVLPGCQQVAVCDVAA